MNRLKYLLCVCVLLIVSVSSAEWLEWGAGCPEGDSPLVRHNTTQTQYISFDVELHGLLADSVEYDSDHYWRFTDSPGVSVTDSVGLPELPVVTCFVIVPDDTDLDVIYSANCSETIEGLTVYPAPLDSLVFDNGARIEEFFRQDSAAYASTDWYPEDLAVISGKFMLRDQRVAIVDVYPVQYLASEDSLRVWSDIEVAIEFEELDPDWNEEDLGPYEQIIGETLIGYRPEYSAPSVTTGSVAWHTDLSQDPPFEPDYMIIVADGLADTQAEEDVIEDFADYRAALNGFDVLMTKTDDIFDEYHQQGIIYLMSSDIRDYMEDIWEYCEGDRPSYLLLIGDHEAASYYLTEDWFLPTRSITLGGNSTYTGYGNDEWYVYFDEPRAVGEAFPDMIVGRLPARDPDTLEDMLLLIEDYEEEITGTPPVNVQYRRYLTRLAGTDNDGGETEDVWEPSDDWTEDFKDWLGYSWDNYYCGDADAQTSSDGSTMSSDDWVDACNTVFERGSQVAFYSDHGDFHMFSAGLYWDDQPDPPPANFGTPDSTFDDCDVRDLAAEVHWHPYVLMFCCSSGTFDHREDDHDDGNEYPCLCYANTPVPYDFSTDCLAEEFVLNAECGAIGVFASSGVSNISIYGPMGREMLKAIYCRGISRLGDAVQAGRLASLGYFWNASTGEWYTDLGRFNLLGDPALDIGDRMKYRGSNCDLVISPYDLAINAYPTEPIGATSGTIEWRVWVRNIGWASSTACDVELSVEWNESVTYLEEDCPSLDPGEETLLIFDWTIPSGIQQHDIIELTAEADPDEVCTESWLPNNTASTTIEYWDSYPNDDGWPLQLDGSIKAPPLLANLDEDSDLEIVVAVGRGLIEAYNHGSSTPIWSVGVGEMYPWGSGHSGYCIPAAGDVTGDGDIEIVVDTKDKLYVLDGSDGSTICSYSHDDLGSEWKAHPHVVTLADVFQGRPTKDEIVFLVGDMLYILGVTSSSTIQVLESFDVCPGENSDFSWVAAADLDGSGGTDLIVTVCDLDLMGSEDWTLVGLYSSSDPDGFYVTEEWTGENTFFKGIPAVETLPTEGLCIALSRKRSTASFDPVHILDADDLSLVAECDGDPTLNSNQVLCCLLADWVTGTGVDRILAVGENQCFAWDEEGGDPLTGWSAKYGDAAGTARPPFPALGNLDYSGQEDLITATRKGTVFAYNSGAQSLTTLGFPYELPSEVYGGFVIADIDRDEMVEVVFGTMDNYLHVWELDQCSIGYSPWLQCQHDAARTGALIE